MKPSCKESTYVRYHYLFSHYISPMIGDRLVYTFSNKDCEVFLNRLLVSGKSDGSGLAPKTVTDIRSVVKLILKTAEKEGGTVSLQPGTLFSQVRQETASDPLSKGTAGLAGLFIRESDT